LEDEFGDAEWLAEAGETQFEPKEERQLYA
jgi:hypothetical protein